MKLKYASLLSILFLNSKIMSMEIEKSKKRDTDEALALYLLNKTNINKQDKEGRTPLMLACLNKNLDLVKFLIQYKPDLKIKDIYGDNALKIAGKYGNEDIANVIINEILNHLDESREDKRERTDNYSEEVKENKRKRTEKDKSEKPYQCSIPECSKRFKTLDNLNQHIERNHISENRVKCDKCDKTFANSACLALHNNTIHNTDIKYFYCKYCNKKFNQLSNKNKHERNIHEKEKKVNCRKCKEKFDNNQELKNHLLNVHKVNTIFECKECDIIFSSSDPLNKHLKFAHSNKEKIKCDKCDYSTARADNLKRHNLTRHNDNKETKFRFKCDKCDKAYTENKRLIVHKRKAHNNDNSN